MGEQEWKDGVGGRETLLISNSQEPQARLVALVPMSLPFPPFGDWLYPFTKPVPGSKEGSQVHRVVIGNKIEPN